MSSQMRAFRRIAKAPWAAATVSVPRPEPGPGQYLLQVIEAACCGSDLHALNNAPGTEAFPAAFTFGHEVGAVIAGCGDGCDLPVGTPVTMVAIQGCGSCRECTSGYMQLCLHRRVQGLMVDGGMAEYVVVDQPFVKPVPADLSVTARALIEPTTIAAHCVDLLGNVEGMRIVLPGAGIIGLLCALVARRAGANVTLTGLAKDRDTRLAAADRLGFKTLITGPGEPSLYEQYLRQSGGEQADILLDASGSPAAVVEGWASGYNSVVRPGGEVMLVAIYETPFNDFYPTSLVRWQRRLTTSYGSDPKDYNHAIRLLQDRVIPVEELVTRYPLENALQAYRDAAESRVLKPVITCAV